MSKMVVGGVCLAAGLVAGVFAGPMVNDGGLKDAKTAKEAAVKAQEKAETDAKAVVARVAELESAESGLRSKLSSAESVAEMRAAEAKQAREAATSVANALAEAEKKADAATAELATLKSGGAGVNAAAGGPVDAAEAARIAQVKAKGRVLADKIKARIAAGEKKDEILVEMRSLAALGKDAAKEFFDAYALIVAKGNPWGPADKNELGLTAFEFNPLFPPELQAMALADTSGDVSAGTKISAMWSTAFMGAQPTADKVKTFGDILDGTREAAVATNAMQVLGYMKSKDAVPYLTRAAGNGALDADTRATAVGMMARYGDDADWATIDTLTHDADPKIAGAAKAAGYVRKPPATGLLVTAFDPTDGGQGSDVRVGDIIQKYNGAVITTEDSLFVAMEAEKDKGTQEIVLDIFRDGKSDRVRIKPGRLGVSGVEVKLKN
jgi:hypothetical protein